MKKKMEFFGIFLTSMYRSSDLAGRKHNFFHYQHPTYEAGCMPVVTVGSVEISKIAKFRTGYIFFIALFGEDQDGIFILGIGSEVPSHKM